MRSGLHFAAWRAAAMLGALLLSREVLAASQPKHLAPVPAATLASMAARDTPAASPILMRLYKKESELEVWKKAKNGRFVLLKTFPICRWSGQLGPKRKVGDRQAPEGFYSVAAKQMNPNSSYHLSFDIGFPNAYDRAHGATGSHLMVHGACSSAGCFAMTDKTVEEIYALAREAFEGGQQAFQFQAFPFRMTAQNMAKHRKDPNIGFWRQLKEGSDRFEATGEEPVVSVSAGRYAFAPLKDPAKEALAQARRFDEEARIAALIEDGAAAIRTAYADGAQHASFMALARRGVSLGEVSRPEALASAGREIVLIPARPKRPACPDVACSTQLADTKGAASQAADSVRLAAPLSNLGSHPSSDAEAVAVLFVRVPLGGDPGQARVIQGAIPGAVQIVPSNIARTAFVIFAQR
jgi:murein L,D-transpeptidase YafK